MEIAMSHQEIFKFLAVKLADLAKKSQKVPNEKNSPKNFFLKFQKRSKKVEKMILSPMEVVSEWGNREKVVKKEKQEIFLRFQRP